MDYFTKLIKYAEGRNVLISTYNCNWNNFVTDDMAWKVIHGHIKELGIKFDPSHSIGAGRDYLTEARDWGKRFNHVHIKGSVRVGGVHFDHSPAGMDQTDWGSFFSILYGHGYDRGISIEPHSEIWKDELGEKGLDFTIKKMREYLFL
jgi:sugar phosphate isomerase/epimerase